MARTTKAARAGGLLDALGKTAAADGPVDSCIRDPIFRVHLDVCFNVRALDDLERNAGERPDLGRRPTV